MIYNHNKPPRKPIAGIIAEYLFFGLVGLLVGYCIAMPG